MTEKCPVCQTDCEEYATACSVCGFAYELGINRKFLIQEDAKHWQEIVMSCRAVWEKARNRESELVAQLEDANKQKAALQAELEAAKKSAIQTTSPLIQQQPSQTGNKNNMLVLLCSIVVVIAVIVFILWIQPTDEKYFTFTDSRDGKIYKTVKISTQTWMAENLNYNVNGSKYYGNKPENCDKYGRLYNWELAKKSCPSGWYLPSDEEWNILMNFMGGEKLAGVKLKAKNGWNNDGNGTDYYGFSALPGGYGNSVGNFYSAGYNGNWWSSSEYENGSVSAYYRGMLYNIEFALRGYVNKSGLFSVRCVQDYGASRR